MGSFMITILLTLYYADIGSTQCCATHCSTPSTTAGCSQDTACQNVICNFAPDCCDNQWDAACTDYAFAVKSTMKIGCSSGKVDNASDGSILCDYYNENTYSVLQYHQIADAIVIYKDKYEITFDIILNDYCSSGEESVCNILAIGTGLLYPYLLSISIYEYENIILLQFQPDDSLPYGMYSYYIDNANVILPVDNQHHSIYFLFTPNEQEFRIDNVRYFYHYAGIEYNSQYPTIPVYPLYVNKLYQYYLVNATMNASVSNICIKSATFAPKKQMRCGETLTGMLNSEGADSYFIYFDLDNKSTVLFDSCGSDWLMDVSMIFWDLNDNDNVIANKVYMQGSCNTQILIHELEAGQYVLQITSTNNHYGNWTIYSYCTDEDYFSGDASCGDTVTGTLTDAAYRNFYRFHLECSSYVMVDLCHQLSLGYFVYLKEFGSDMLVDMFPDMYDRLERCDHNSNSNWLKLIVWLNASDYVLEIFKLSDETETQYNFPITCDCEKDSKYVVKQTILNYYFYNFEDAELFCEYQYGTSLATIRTMADSDDLELILVFYQASDFPLNAIWIGMYSESLTDNEWRWIDGTHCSENNNCFDDVFYNLSVPSAADQRWRYGMNIAVISYNWSLASNTSFIGGNYAVNGIVCNAPDSTYSWHDCNSTDKCWKRMEFINDSSLENDFEYTLVHKFGFDAPPFHEEFSYQLDPYNINLFSPPIAIWRNTLYIFGLQNIHYTHFKLSGNAYLWKMMPYDINFNWTANIILQSIQVYAQHESLMYLYDSNLDKLVIIDLNDNHLESLEFNIKLSKKSDIIINDTVNCMVADANHIYVVDATKLSIYTINTNSWHASSNYSDEFDETFPISCSIAYDRKFIYVFSFSKHANRNLKYNIETGIFNRLSIVNPCNCGRAKTVTAPNGKIYFHGCYVTPFKTLVFNPKIDKFESLTHGVDTAMEIDPITFRKAQMTIFDDNILLLLHPTKTLTHSFSIYYMVTDLISINFENTISTTSVWPSDGFNIIYHLNDFIDSQNNIYYVAFYSNDTGNAINEVIILNRSNDGCICNTSIYKCYDCSQHFDLRSHLTLNDSNIKNIKVFINPHSEQRYVTTDQMIIMQEYTTIKLQRCEISFENVHKISFEDDPMISFHYSLSTECYSRTGTNFSVYITAPLVNIQKELIISVVVDGKSHMCRICPIVINMKKGCEYCNDEYFRIKHDLIESVETFQVLFKSNSIDLTVGSSNNFEVALDKKEKMSLLEIAGIALGVLVVFLVVIGCCLRNRKLKTKNRLLKEEQTRNLHYIRNPMVITIGIAFYDNDSTNKNSADFYCPDLNGIDRDYANIKKLCDTYKYDFYPKYEKYDWTQDDIISFIKEHAKKAVDEIDTLKDDVGSANKRVNGYDGIICVISGHGYQNNIITSDYQYISKTSIHRLLTTNHPELRTIPRIFVYDSCSGEQQQSTYPAGYTDDDSQVKEEEEEINIDKGKHFKMEDIEIKQYNEEIWKSNQVNPDFKLSTIHGSNEGFMAKMNSVDGSYLIYEYVKRMINNIEMNENLFFGDIIDSIQQYLHDKGKQQIKAVFNNHTRCLKFITKYIQKSETEKQQKINREEVTTNKPGKSVDVQMTQTNYGNDNIVNDGQVDNVLKVNFELHGKLEAQTSTPL